MLNVVLECCIFVLSLEILIISRRPIREGVNFGKHEAAAPVDTLRFSPTTMSSQTAGSTPPSIDYSEPVEAFTVHPHVPKPRLKATPLTKEEWKEQNERQQEAASALHFAMEEWFVEIATKAEELAEEHGKSTQYMLSQLFTSAPQAVQQDTQKVNIWNTFLWKLAHDKTSGLS